MISIASAMQQDAIKELLEGYNEEGMTFTFKEKQGIKMFFETSAEDPEAAAKKSKGTNQSTALGNSPLFSVNSCLRKWFKKIGWLI